MFRRAVVLCLALSAVALGFAAPASAHIDPDPAEAQAGSALSVGFTVEHGCEGSPTVQLDMRLPAGVTGASPDPVDGWEGSIEGDVITFVGGPLPDDVEGTFSVSMTLPPTPDVTIYFPFVQRCEEGEIRWIAIPTEPDEELDEPAPAMLLTGPVATTVAPATTEAPVTSEASATTPTTTPATSTTSTEVTATTDAAATTDVAASAEVATSSSVPAVAVSTDGSSDTGTIAFIVSMLAIAGIGVYVWFRSRSARAAAG